MTEDPFTVLLDRKEGHSASGLEAGVVTLRGKSVFREGGTGLADSLDEIAGSGLLLVPTFPLVAGRAHAPEEDDAWQEYHDSRAERNTLLDTDGILGKKGDIYVLDVQNGGLFVHTPSRIREAVEGNQLVNYALELEQEEVSAFLDAMKREDLSGLKQILHGERMAFAGEYDAFLEASGAPDFLEGMDATYAVVRPLQEAQAVKTGHRPIDEQRDNPDLVIASGGRVLLGKMLDQAASFKMKKFGSWNDGYEHPNTGRVVSVDYHSNGLNGCRGISGYGRGVGIVRQSGHPFGACRCTRSFSQTFL